MFNGINKPIHLDDVVFKESKASQNSNEWSWVNPKHGEFDHPANYYESSLADWHTFDALNSDQVCDVVVIGGGLLGASAALHLSEQGVDTILVEKNRIGSSASGRNGGQLTPGLARWEAEEMIKRFSYEDAKKLWYFTSTEAMSLIDQISEKYDVELARKRGHITAAVHEGHLIALTQGADARKYLGENNTTVMGEYELKQLIKSDLYKGGLVDDLGGHIQPLALNRALIHGFSKNGGQVFEQTEVFSISEQADGVYVKTSGGTIKARKSVVIAVHHNAFKLLPEKKQTAIPFHTYIAVTAPLEVPLTELLPQDHPVYDTQLQIDYYRGVSKNRLLFGGQGTGTSWSVGRINQYLLGRTHKVFPQLNQVEMDFCWSGVSDLTVNGATDNRKFGEKYPIYAVHGWSGHGVAQTVRIGKAIADDFSGLNTDYAMLTRIQHSDILFGRLLAPLAIPMSKGWYGMTGMLNPGKMVSF
ncbi:FAD binding domain protein [Acinetobacter baumannii 1437282]|nr:FAD binding domain protein [Acinetobacter baumannii 1437282]